jgi:hypothetical protein
MPIDALEATIQSQPVGSRDAGQQDRPRSDICATRTND